MPKAQADAAAAASGKATQPPPRPPIVKIVVSLLVVAGLGGLLVYKKGISLGDVLQTIGHFPPSCVLFVFLCSFVQGVFNVFRIYSLFPKGLRPRLGRVAYAISVGQLANTFLPARAGDFLKAVIFGREDGRPGIPVMAGAGVIMADKAIDFTAFISLIFFSGAYRMPGVKMPTLPNAPGVAMASGVALVLLIGGAIWFLRTKLVALRKWLHDFRAGLAGLLRPSGVLTGYAMGLGVWVSEAVALMLLAHYQGYSLSIGQSVFVLCVLNLAIAVPVSVANVGTFEASIGFGLNAAGIPLPVAVAIAATHHILQWLAVISLAAIMIVRERPAVRKQ